MHTQTRPRVTLGADRHSASIYLKRQCHIMGRTSAQPSSDHDGPLHIMCAPSIPWYVAAVISADVKVGSLPSPTSPFS